MTAILKAGMVGLDTSHCQAFLEVLHEPAHAYHVPGIRVSGVFAGGSEQFSRSRERVQNFSAEINERFHIPVYDSIANLARDVDVLFLSSVDGRQHLEQFSQLAVGKPVFIDKPLATSCADAAAIIQLAAATHTPLMSCSSLRFAMGIAELAEARADILACEAYGPTPILADFPGYFWYGIHSAEILFSLMGTGCQSVRTIASDKMDVICAIWQDGRSGVLLGQRFEGYEFGSLIHTRGAARLGVAIDTPPYHACLLREIAGFFQTGQSPIDLRETYQIIAFLEAANQSKAENGASVRVAQPPDWM